MASFGVYLISDTMKNTLFLISLIGLLALPGAMWAQDLEVDFVDGTVEVRDGGDWEEIFIGDTVGRQSVMRVGDGAIIELSGAQMRITVSNAGTYKLSDLLAGTSSGSSKNLQSFLRNSLSLVMEKSTAGTSSAVMGARAADLSKEEKFEWIDEDEEILAEGRALIEEGRYDEAAEFFEEELDYAEDYVAGHYLFYLGYAHAMLGKRGLALKELGSIDPDPSEEYFDDWSLTFGQLLYESLAFEGSLAVFKAYLEHFPEGKNAQEAHAFSGLCFQQLGDNDAAAGSFKRAVALDPDSDIGKMVAGWATN